MEFNEQELKVLAIMFEYMDTVIRLSDSEYISINDELFGISDLYALGINWA